MSKRIYATEQAPAAIGPYVQATSDGRVVYTSGQLGLDVETGELADGVEAQARVALANLGAILEAAGSRPQLVLKTTVFLTRMADFAAVNAVYADFFGDEVPARSCVAVAELPRGALVEIECVALLDEA